MKTLAKIISLSLALTAPIALLAAEKITAGPKGGRLFETKPLAAEFFVNADRKIEINFYDAALKPATPDTQVVTVTAEPKSGSTKVGLDKTPTGFISTEPLPEANDPYRVVVQIRPSAEAKPQNFRVDLNLETCGECKHAEYACTCGH